MLVLAVALDLLLGDPPNRYHPVAWIGRLIALGRRWAASVPTDLLVVYGALLIVVVTITAVMGALAAQAAAGWLPWPGSLLAQAWLLKCSFSLRNLVAAVWEVRDRLDAGDLAGAREAVGRHLVSRPVEELEEGATASAAVESLAENLNDSWVAPLCFYLVGGLPGAWAYRAVNTADAMIGYREGMLEQLGGASARLDDLLNLVPSRFAALALAAGARLGGESGSRAWDVWRRDGASTASPNAGQTMAAMAGALGVTLEKRGHYRLGDGPAPDVAVIDRAVGVFAAAAGVALVAALVLLRAFR
ncbi:MAG: adenosylcobinamide-phosphate synthase CbiB [Candidatus Rokubacteria bacterium]|nr:adenosylcobinamide-phosphate synthase CbiB [Candidatus Rokubacteria bacterium]